MKYFIFAFIFLSSFYVTKVRAQDVYVSYQTFYDALTPYGQWIDDPQYGYVWVPGVDEDFRPYFTHGHWVMTEYGNTWASEYPWGWACFHYGRWTYNDYYGWIWVPGDEWGPGWVSWRMGDGYCGWAPLYPGWGSGQDFYGPEDWWTFMRPKHMYKSFYQNMWRADFWRGPSYNGNILNHTSYVTNTGSGENGVVYPFGPRVSDIEGITHKPVQVYDVKEARGTGAEVVSGKELTIYKPTKIEALDKDGDKSIPQHAITAPQRINTPQQLRVTANQPHEFKTTYMGRASVPNQASGSASYGGSQPANATYQQQGRNNNNSAPRNTQSAAPMPRQQTYTPAPRPAPAPAAPRQMPAAAPAARPMPSGGGGRR